MPTSLENNTYSYWKKVSILSLLALICVLPPLLSYWIYYYHRDWASSNLTHRGMLLRPAIPALAPHAKWRLMVFNPGTCDATCQGMLNGAWRLRVSLGRKFYQLETILIDSSIQHTQSYRKYTAIPMGSLSSKSRKLLNQPMFAIIDPKGNMVMLYQIPDLSQRRDPSNKSWGEGADKTLLDNIYADIQRLIRS